MTLIPNFIRHKYVTYARLELITDASGREWMANGVERVKNGTV